MSLDRDCVVRSSIQGSLALSIIEKDLLLARVTSLEQRRVWLIEVRHTAFMMLQVMPNVSIGRPYDNSIQNGRGVYNYKSTIDQ